MAFRHAYLVPIFIGVWFPLTFVITYVTSVLRNNVVPVFPYISDTGNWPVESCIFALMMNVGAILMGLTVYIRYRQLKHELEKTDMKSKSKLNEGALWLGLVAAFGVSVVGDFQETAAFPVHIAAAGAAFGLGSVYLCVQSHLSWKLYPAFGSKTVNIIRTICSVICSVTFLLTFVFAVLAMFQFKGKDITKWTQKDGGYVFHVISAGAEWILALSTILYLAMFTGDFKKISVSEPPFEYNELVA